jgi:alcohol dehydrogenase, propanol-preferring
MVLHRPGDNLQLENVPDPEPSANQILIAVEACGVCRPDLHIIDGDLTQPKLPLIPDHEIVGRIVRIGEAVAGFTTGMRQISGFFIDNSFNIASPSSDFFTSET